MTIEQFIEMTIQGGYDIQWRWKGYVQVPSRKGKFLSIERILLDPEAWKAFVRSVETEKEPEFGTPDEQFISDVAQTKMFDFMRRLWEGKTLDQAIEMI